MLVSRLTAEAFTNIIHIEAMYSSYISRKCVVSNRNMYSIHKYVIHFRKGDEFQ